MSLKECAAMTPAEAGLLHPLQLAYIGDTVWDMLVRTKLLGLGFTAHHMHEKAVKQVNAAAQARALDILSAYLNDEETEIARRGRNAHAHHPTPKNQRSADYAAATGLEALFGYLYITEQDQRVHELFERWAVWREKDAADETAR